MEPRIGRVLTLMERELHHKLSVEMMARAANLSPSLLHRLFKSEIGMTPMNYLRKCRMKKARGLLETTFLSVKEVARRVGVYDASHFVRDFEKAFGVTPARYRTRCSSGNHQAAVSRKSGSAGSANELPNPPINFACPAHRLTIISPPPLRS